MRHQVAGSHLSRDAHERKSLFRNLVRSLVENGEIVTTEPKGKELKRIADKIIHQAQTDSLTSRRVLHRFFGRRDVVNTLVERIAPAFKDRTSGFTSIAKLANRRGDNGAMVRITLMAKPELIGTLKNPDSKTKVAQTKVARAAKPKVVSKTSVAAKAKAKTEAAKTIVSPAKTPVVKTDKAAKPIAKRVQKAAV